MSDTPSVTSHDGIEAISAWRILHPSDSLPNPPMRLQHPACQRRKSARSSPHGHRGCLSLRFLQFINGPIILHSRMPLKGRVPQLAVPRLSATTRPGP